MFLINAQLLVDSLSLGKLINPPKKLLGGALHTVYKLETSEGSYALKQVNPHVTAKPQFRTSYELSETIARRFAEHNIPAVHALPFNDQFIISLNARHYLLYPFIEGSLLSEAIGSLKHGAYVGELYARIHNLPNTFPDITAAHYDYFNDEHWHHLIHQSKNAELITLLPQILQWNNQYKAIIPSLTHESVITHRDMHLQNVLWDSNTKPYILDWESAGLMNPLVEVIGYGLEWSGIILHQQVNQNVYQQLFHAYNQQILIPWITTPQEAFLGWLGHCVLAWTEFNVQRMNGNISEATEEIIKGREIIMQKMIPCLKFIAAHQLLILTLIQTSYSN